MGGLTQQSGLTQKVSDTPERRGLCGKVEGAKVAGAWAVTRRRVRSTVGLGHLDGREIGEDL